MSDRADDGTEQEPRQSRRVQRLSIEVLEGPDAGLRLQPEGRVVAVGQAADNEIVLGDPTVSRYHLELTRTEDGVGVLDLDSKNGTFAGSIRLHRALVPPGTRLTLGRTVLRLTDGATADLEEPRPFALPGIVGDSPRMREVAAQIERLAGASASVLVLGETGSGKEVVARAIHQLGPRKDRPFVVVDCGSMPGTLVASELFGHERGAFTGADSRRVGAFERAEGGTVLLDEIGELPIAVQPSLLGVLERRQFRRVGGDKEIAVDVRVLAATHRDLRAEVNRGNFRPDLYFRLAVARILIPPLRERPDDIPALVAHFVRELTGDPSASLFGDAAMAALIEHPWSGNVRELRNVVESTLAMGRLSLESAAAPRTAAPPARARASLPPHGASSVREYRDARAEALAKFELEYLQKLMAETDNNASEAARRARMDRPYLLSLLRKHGLR